ncbi:uncharacterized protein BNAC09G06230D isoform X1 [Brassica napus]|uniref:uncharacterized protein BNAC09G06230D isoform X1 n=1 Tax=Brassica napus TaxID=3708 RepID=UPI002079AF8B|nr:uncharacterized protein BNAC09G06230D isoform X1 [Brassica napus]XP_048625788.1 uncharacterized protein BNAC09G06230D isoform X1 [Brassica napus]
MSSVDDLKGNVTSEAEKSMPSSHQEEAAVKNKYGGLMPKKPPLISKDHERAYFDSADWALGKVSTVVLIRVFKYRESHSHVVIVNSKVLLSQRDPSKLFVPSYSQHSSRRGTGSLHVLHPMAVKMEEELLRPREFPATRSRDRREKMETLV